MRSIVLASILFFGVAVSVHAESRGLDATSDFEAQKQQIEQALQDGKLYSEIAPVDREAVRGALARITALLSKAGDVSHLDAEQKIAVFNDQERINTILSKAASDSRLVCKREVKTGSHRATTQCMTVAERERAREHAQDELRNTPSRSLKGE